MNMAERKPYDALREAAWEAAQPKVLALIKAYESHYFPKREDFGDEYYTDPLRRLRLVVLFADKGLLVTIHISHVFSPRNPCTYYLLRINSIDPLEGPFADDLEKARELDFDIQKEIFETTVQIEPVDLLLEFEVPIAGGRTICSAIHGEQSLLDQVSSPDGEPIMAIIDFPLDPNEPQTVAQ